MKTKTNLILSLIISLLVFVVGVNIPIKYFSFNYWSGQNLGTTVTTISSTDLLSNFPTVFNTNMTNLNNDKIEATQTTLNSLTSATSLASLPALSTVGTITSGTWNATAISVAKGGTGTTSPSIYQVILGNGANGLTIASSTGTTGQFLTSNGPGAYPSWTTSAIDQAGNYVWTGQHSFSNLFSISNTGTSTIAVDLNVGRLLGASYFNATSTTATSTFKGGTKMDYATTTNLTVGGTCFGCVKNGYERVTTVQALNGGSPSSATWTVDCSSGKYVLSCGLDGVAWGTGAGIIDMYPSSNSTCSFSAQGANGATDNLTGYAICIIP